MPLKGTFVMLADSKRKGHMGKHQCSQEAEGVREKCGQESLLWFLWEGMGRLGAQLRIG